MEFIDESRTEGKQRRSERMQSILDAFDGSFLEVALDASPTGSKLPEAIQNVSRKAGAIIRVFKQTAKKKVAVKKNNEALENTKLSD